MRIFYSAMRLLGYRNAPIGTLPLTPEQELQEYFRGVFTSRSSLPPSDVAGAFAIVGALFWFWDTAAGDWVNSEVSARAALNPMTTLSAPAAGSSVTTLSVNQILAGSTTVRLFSGNQFEIVHAVTGEARTLTCQASYQETAAAITITPADFTDSFPAGSALYLPQTLAMRNALLGGGVLGTIFDASGTNRLDIINAGETRLNVPATQLLKIQQAGADVRQFPDPAWTAVTFQNSWIDIGGSWQTTGYRKNGNRVTVKIGATGGVSSTVAFTLPSGYRPPARIPFHGVSTNLSVAYQVVFWVYSSGLVVPIYDSGSTGVAGWIEFTTD